MTRRVKKQTGDDETQMSYFETTVPAPGLLKDTSAPRPATPEKQVGNTNSRESVRSRSGLGWGGNSGGFANAIDEGKDQREEQGANLSDYNQKHSGENKA